jgi:hypothetical protein
MARKANAFSFTRTIADKREDLARARAEIAALAEQSDAFKAAYAIANTIARKAESLDFARWMHATPETRTDWEGVAQNSLLLIVEDYATSLKDGAVPALCEFVMAQGLDTTGSDDWTGEFSAERKFKFAGRVGQVDLQVRVIANIKDGSDACRKVVTGTTLKEVNTYEIVCA